MDDDCLSGIEYHGVAGSTVDCLRAVERLLHYGEHFERALILTCRQPKHTTSHCLLLTTAIGDLIAIKSGFSSGYWGTGPSGLSRALGLLHWHKVELEEIEVEPAVIGRIDGSALTNDDLENFATARRIRPTRLWDYISERDFVGPEARNPWLGRESVIPLGIIDDRLADLARTFWRDPDAALSKGYRQLEAIVRERIGIGLEESAKLGPSKLFARAFNGDDAPLSWPKTVASEREGRANLFVGMAKAYRNPRAHREVAGHPGDQLGEFLLLNHLYKLEGEALLATDLAEPPSHRIVSERIASAPDG